MLIYVSHRFLNKSMNLEESVVKSENFFISTVFTNALVYKDIRSECNNITGRKTTLSAIERRRLHNNIVIQICLKSL